MNEKKKNMQETDKFKRKKLQVKQNCFYSPQN